MSLPIPPLYEKITQDDDKVNLNWTIFFQSLADGDVGTAWTPTFVNLTSVGTPTIEGRYYQLSKYITFFRITITPTTNTSSVATSTYCDNIPVVPTASGVCAAVGNTVGVGLGIVTTTGRIYTPDWTAATVPITILGIVEAR